MLINHKVLESQFVFGCVWNCCVMSIHSSLSFSFSVSTHFWWRCWHLRVSVCVCQEIFAMHIFCLSIDWSNFEPIRVNEQQWRERKKYSSTKEKFDCVQIAINHFVWIIACGVTAAQNWMGSIWRRRRLTLCGRVLQEQLIKNVFAVFFLLLRSLDFRRAEIATWTSNVPRALSERNSKFCGFPAFGRSTGNWKVSISYYYQAIHTNITWFPLMKRTALQIFRRMQTEAIHIYESDFLWLLLNCRLLPGFARQN